MADAGRVFVHAATSTAEEWKRALEAPEADLPKLTEEQKDSAKRFGISEEEYARGVLAGDLGKKRLEEFGHRLRELALQTLARLGTGYDVKAVIFEGFKMRWIVRVQLPSGQLRNLDIPDDLAEEVLGLELFESIQQFRQRIVSGVVTPI